MKVAQLTTTKAAALWKVLPDTLRKRVHDHGEYLGVKPEKLPNGQFSWPRDTVIATLPRADLSEGEREALADVEACVGAMDLALTCSTFSSHSFL